MGGGHLCISCGASTILSNNSNVIGEGGRHSVSQNVGSMFARGGSFHHFHSWVTRFCLKGLKFKIFDFKET